MQLVHECALAQQLPPLHACASQRLLSWPSRAPRARLLHDGALPLPEPRVHANGPTELRVELSTQPHAASGALPRDRPLGRRCGGWRGSRYRRTRNRRRGCRSGRPRCILQHTARWRRGRRLLRSRRRGWGFACRDRGRGRRGCGRRRSGRSWRLCDATFAVQALLPQALALLGGLLGFLSLLLRLLTLLRQSILDARVDFAASARARGYAKRSHTVCETLRCLLLDVRLPLGGGHVLQVRRR